MAHHQHWTMRHNRTMAEFGSHPKGIMGGSKKQVGPKDGGEGQGKAVPAEPPNGVPKRGVAWKGKRGG